MRRVLGRDPAASIVNRDDHAAAVTVTVGLDGRRDGDLGALRAVLDRVVDEVAQRTRDVGLHAAHLGAEGDPLWLDERDALR